VFDIVFAILCQSLVCVPAAAAQGLEQLKDWMAEHSDNVSGIANVKWVKYGPFVVEVRRLQPLLAASTCSCAGHPADAKQVAWMQFYVVLCSGCVAASVMQHPQTATYLQQSCMCNGIYKTVHGACITRRMSLQLHVLFSCMLPLTPAIRALAAAVSQVLRRAAEHYSAQLAGRIDPEAELSIDYDQLRQQCEAAAAGAAAKPAGG
jgi:hypothetical protein